jgi:hypothetical protein
MWLGTDAQFRESFSEAMQRCHKELGCNVAWNGAVLTSVRHFQNSPAGPGMSLHDELPPPIPAEGLPMTPPHSTHWAGVIGENFGNVTALPSEPEVQHFAYQKPLGAKPQRGEWFHSYGASKTLLSILKTELGVQESHISLIVDKHDERPQMEFSKGKEVLNDYLFILSHEIKMETQASAKAGPSANQRNRHSSIIFSEAAEGQETSSRTSRAEEDLVVLEERQIFLFFFPERNMVFSIRFRTNSSSCFFFSIPGVITMSPLPLSN